MNVLMKQIISLSCTKTTIIIRPNVRNASRRIYPYIPLLKKNVVPEIYFSLDERLKEKDEAPKDPELYKMVNIGLPYKDKKQAASKKSRRTAINMKDSIELEKKSKDCTLIIELEEVEKDWISSNKPKHIKAVAENYQIFEHLYGKFAYFYPVIHMDIYYDYDESTLSPVYFGNLLKPKETTKEPSVSFTSEPDTLWTLILTNPDGNLYDNETEIIHWFIGNIPGNRVEAGEKIIEYLQPVPPKGTGFHRYVFVLYKQNNHIDFSKYKKSGSCLLLKERNFKTFEFYKEHQDILTPAGLSWFQADWDSTLTDFFHNTLKMREPHYEYEFPKPYIAPQVYFPKRRPFNRYLDLHRDKKEQQKLMLLKRLANVHPFHGEKPRYPFPQAVSVDEKLPIWLQNEIREERDGSGKYKDIYRGDDRPYQFLGRPTPLVAFRPSSTRKKGE